MLFVAGLYRESLKGLGLTFSFSVLFYFFAKCLNILMASFDISDENLRFCFLHYYRISMTSCNFRGVIINSFLFSNYFQKLF
jgi:hypothetical protein